MAHKTASLPETLLQDLTKTTEQNDATLQFYECSDASQFSRFCSALSIEKKIPLIHVELTEGARYSPLGAFFEFLQYRIKTSILDVEEIVSRATDYLPLRNILISRLKDTEYIRNDLPVLDDLKFEEMAMMRAFTRLIELVVTEPTFIMVSNIHFACRKALEQLMDLAKAKLHAPLICMVCFEARKALRIRREEDGWWDFIGWLDDGFQLNAVPNLNVSEHVSLHLKVGDKLDYALLKHNMLVMAWPQAVAVAKKLLTKNSMSYQHRFALKLDLATALLYSGKPEDALNTLQPIQDWKWLRSSVKDHVRLLNILALIRVKLQHFDHAMQAVRLALDIAETTQDHRLQTQTEFIDFYVHDKSATRLDVNAFFKLVSKLKQQEMYNSRLYCLRNLYTFLKYYDHLDIKCVMRFTQQALMLARLIGHQHGVAACYQSKGILFLFLGKIMATYRCFNVSLKLREGLGEPLEIARIHNGIGYVDFLRGKNDQAMEHYVDAYAAVRSDSDTNELVMTLYNFAWVYFCTRHYRSAVDILEYIVRICRIRSTIYFPFRNLFDVLSVKAFCHTKLGELTRAQQCLDRLEEISLQPSQIGKSLKPFAEGALLASTDKLNEALKRLDFASDVISNNVAESLHLSNLLSMEKLEVLSRQSNWHACEVLLKACLKRCRSSHLPQSYGLFKLADQAIRARKRLNSVTFPLVPLRKVSLHLDELMGFIDREAKLVQANQRLREVRLLSRLQSLTDSIESPKELAVETLRMICAGFSLSSGDIHLKSAEGWQPYCVEGSFPQSFKISKYLELLEDTKRTFTEVETNNSVDLGLHDRFNSIISIPVEHEGTLNAAMTLYIWNSRRFFNQHDQNILKLMAEQFATQLKQLRQREQLFLVSTTDSVTGILNRQALQARLEQELDSMRRTGQPDVCSLAFIDLDNFKAVNDTFGHAAGDQLLEAFAQVLQQTLRHNDIAARWGGDEFVVLLPEINSEQAGEVAKRLMQAIEARDYFVFELAEWGDLSDAPGNVGLDCSVGIAHCHASQLSGVENDWLLKQADKVLYQAKESGKGRIYITNGKKAKQIS